MSGLITGISAVLFFTGCSPKWNDAAIHPEVATTLEANENQTIPAAHRSEMSLLATVGLRQPDTWDLRERARCVARCKTVVYEHCLRKSRLPYYETLHRCKKVRQKCISRC